MYFQNIIIGIGVIGITLAERFVNIGEDVLLIEKRSHIGGNCYDEYAPKGIRGKIYNYGLRNADFIIAQHKGS